MPSHMLIPTIDFAFIKQREKDLPKKKEYDDYSFRVNRKVDINFKEINDDLSYSDPLRIIKFRKETYAMVHHSILNKYLRSVLENVIIQDSILKHISLIEEKDVKVLINQIRIIKQAKWNKYNQSNSKGRYEVIVTKVKI